MTANSYTFPLLAAIVSLGSVLLTSALVLLKRKTKDAIPRLGESIPFVSNVLQFMSDKRTFFDRVSKALEKSDIVQCQLGPINAYFITGDNNISTMFKPSGMSDPWILRILENAGNYPRQDLSRLARDNTGPSRVPLPGSNPHPPEQRIWFNLHRVHDEHLANARAVNTLSSSFQDIFAKELDVFPVGQWKEVRVFDYLRRHMTRALIATLIGPGILETDAKLVDKFWNFHFHTEKLAFGLPKWLNKEGIRNRDEFRSSCLEWFYQANGSFDWEKDYSNVEYEDTFGSRFGRELAGWYKSIGFTEEGIGSAFALLIFGLASNTVPFTVWYVMELIKDPVLFAKAKKTVSEAIITDANGQKMFDTQKLALMPLMQSIYIEVLRLHVSIMITRTLREPVHIAGHLLPKGAVVQAPSHVCHRTESVWGEEGHPASEFWSERHVRGVTVKDADGKVSEQQKFSMEGRAGSFIPYGGGAHICPGRHLAKQAIILVAAMAITKFDIEFDSWMNLDGSPSPSDEPAGDDVRYAGAHALPPNKDMKIKWRRKW